MNDNGVDAAAATLTDHDEDRRDFEEYRQAFHDAYFDARFTYDARRDTVWREVCRYLNRKYIRPDSKLLDLGAGYCNFINNIAAREKHALDLFSHFKKYAAPGVVTHQQSCTELHRFQERDFDVVFASNLFEHLNREELLRTMYGLHKVLRPGGRLVLMQPNFSLCYSTYFDDYTHVETFTHRSLADFVEAGGFRLVAVEPRFMPVNMKSTLKLKLPKLDWIVRFYLALPFRPLAGQALVVAESPAASERHQHNSVGRAWGRI